MAVRAYALPAMHPLHVNLALYDPDSVAEDFSSGEFVW
jgi:hypothetical protein